MEEYKKITIDQIDAKLVGEPLRTNRIISFALVMGTTLFLAIILIIYQTNSSSHIDRGPNAVEEMSFVLLFLSFSIYSMFFLFPKLFLKGKSLKGRLTMPNIKGESDPVMNILLLDRVMMIIRLALLEGVTLFALVVLMISVTSGIIYENENYWLLVLPFLIQILGTISIVPKEKTIARIEREILSRINNL